MPCHPARARELVRNGKAERRFNRGIFYIRLTERENGYIQETVVGIDPGSKKEGFAVKSEAHTYLNIQADAVTWVGKHMETRRTMRRARRYRKTPYRKCRPNRNTNTQRIPPSTKARWRLKLRICNWLTKLYPVTVFVVEDIKATTKKNQRKWNINFSPLEAGKQWFYSELEKLGIVVLKQGYETYAARLQYGLKKLKNKLSDKWEAHCVDSWVLANEYVGGQAKPDNKVMLYVTPLRLHRRQLHRMQPSKGGVRKPYGGTISLGLKRGSWVKHREYGLCYTGGTSKGHVSLHSMQDGKRLCQNAMIEDIATLCYASWRVRKEKDCSFPYLKTEVSAA